jgi:DNA-binding NtrC family response regulator
MRGKVLVVDDYADWRDMLCGLLEREGHLVEAAGTKDAALAYIQETKELDLVILDIRLIETEEANEDGMRLLAEIRKRLSFTRVIMITGTEPWRLSAKLSRIFRLLTFSPKHSLIRMNSGKHFRMPSNKLSAIGKPGKKKN